MAWARPVRVVSLLCLAGGLDGVFAGILIVRLSLFTPENFIWEPILLGAGVLAVTLLRSWRVRSVEGADPATSTGPLRTLALGLAIGLVVGAAWSFAMFNLVPWPPCYQD